MSRVFDGNTANFLQRAGSITTSAIATYGVWVKQPATATSNEVVITYANTASNKLQLGINTDNKVKVRGDQTSSNGNRTTTGTFSNDVWTPIMGRFQTDRCRAVLDTETTGTGFYGTMIAESSPVLTLGRSNGASEPANCKIGHVAMWSSDLSAADEDKFQAGDDPSTISSGTLVAHWPLEDDSLTDTVSSLVLVVNGTVANDDSDNPLIAGPTVTTPTSGTNGTNIQSTGTDLDTVTSSLLKTTIGGHSIALNITAQTTTTINEDFEAGVNDATLGVPANGVPLFAQLLATGSTAWQLQHEVTDGSDANALNFQLNPEATRQTVQAMIAETNQTAGEGFGDPAISITEDDEVWYCPKVVSGVNVTLNTDLTVTVDQDKLITIVAAKFAPSTGQWSVLQYTRGTSLITGVTSLITGPITRSITGSITR